MEGLIALYEEPVALVAGDETFVTEDEVAPVLVKVNGGKRLFATKHTAAPVRDTVTGVEYKSLGACGKALYELVDGDMADTFVFYKLMKAFPSRFERMN